MKKSVFTLAVILACAAVLAAAAWFAYTLVAVDGAGAAPHVPVVLGAIGVFALAALAVRLILAGIDFGQPPSDRESGDEDILK